jgi:hypothetical protein
MTMSAEIRNVIGVLRQRIRKLQEIEAMLTEEFGDAGDSPPVLNVRFVKSDGDGHPASDRKTQLEQFLRLHGPAKRSEIHKGAGMPAGTVAYLLNKYNGTAFIRKHGRWTLPERTLSDGGAAQ